MEYDIYKYSAIVGCTLVLVQVVLQVVGLAGDTDVDHGDAGVDHGDAHIDAGHDGAADGHGNLFFGILSFKALCAFAGLFGLTGLTTYNADFSVPARIGTSFGAGIAGMFFVGWMMRGLSRLQSSGTVNVRNAVGRTGRVYLVVPGENSGMGKVTVELQGRSMEFRAVTDGGEIKTGARVMVAGVEDGEVLKVVPV